MNIEIAFRAAYFVDHCEVHILLICSKRRQSSLALRN